MRQGDGAADGQPDAHPVGLGAPEGLEHPLDGVSSNAGTAVCHPEVDGVAVSSGAACLVRAQVTLACLGPEGRPARMPAALREALARLPRV